MMSSTRSTGKRMKRSKRPTSVPCRMLLCKSILNQMPLVTVCPPVSLQLLQRQARHQMLSQATNKCTFGFALVLAPAQHGSEHLDFADGQIRPHQHASQDVLST